MKTTAALLIPFLLVAPPVRAEQPSTWLGFPDGLNHTLVEEGDSASVRIPVEVLLGSLDKLQCRLRDVVFHEGRAEALAKSFTVQLDAGDQDRAASLLIQTRALPKLPGSYVLSLVVTERMPAVPTVRPQTVSLTLQQASPQLIVRGNLIVDQVVGFLGIENRFSDLKLCEQSKNAGVTGVEFTDIREPSNNLPVDSGKVDVSLNPATVAAGKSSPSAKVTVIGQFPLGKTTGKVEIRADQLATPITVPYEVRAKRTEWWIAIITGLGFSIGFLVRVFLQNRQQLANARAIASRALHDIKLAQARIRDAEFRSAIDKIQDNLQTGVSDAKPETILAAATTARNDLSIALKLLDDRRSAVAAKLEPLSRLVRRAWDLPPGAPMGLLKKLREELDRTSRLLTENDVAGASNHLARLQDEELVQLINALHDWRLAASRYFAELVKYPPALPPDGPAEFAKAVESWKAAFSVKIPTASDATWEKLPVALDEAHSAHVAARDIAGQLKVECQKLVDWVGALFAPPLLLSPNDKLSSLTVVTDTATDAILDDLETPADAQRFLAEREFKLRETWNEILCSTLGKGADQIAITKLLAENRWSEAAQVCADALKAPHKATLGGGTFVSSKPIDQESADAGPAAKPIVFHTALAASGQETAMPLEKIDLLTGSTTERAGFIAEAKVAVFLQTVFFALFFIAVAYGLYADKWVGTFQEMLAMFVWAFGVDITSDAVMSAAKGIKPREGG